MSQKVTQNSTLSQNWVGCTGAHPTDHDYAHGAPRLCALRLDRPCSRRVVACRASYRRLVAGRVAGLAARSVAMPPACIAVHRVAPPAPCRGLLLRCIAAQCRRIATQGRPPSTTIQTFVSRPWSQPSALRAVSRTLGRIGGLLAISWPSSDCFVARYAVSWCAPAHCLPA